MKREFILILMSMLVVTLVSNVFFVRQIMKADFSDWRLYSATLGNVIITSAAIFVLKRIRLSRQANTLS